MLRSLFASQLKLDSRQLKPEPEAKLADVHRPSFGYKRSQISNPSHQFFGGNEEVLPADSEAGADGAREPQETGPSADSGNGPDTWNLITNNKPEMGLPTPASLETRPTLGKGPSLL